MKIKYFLLGLGVGMLLLACTDTHAFEGCNVHTHACKKSPCQVVVAKSIGTIAMVSCTKVSSKPYKDFTGSWQFMYYELEVLNSLEGNNKVFATKIRVREME